MRAYNVCMSIEFIMQLLLQYKYLILVPIAALTGPPTSLVAGVLIRFEFMAFIPTYACLMLGELLGDAAWYWIGYRWGESFVLRFGKYVGLDESSITIAKGLFHRYNQRILLGSKLTTGFGFAIPILFTAGMSRVSFKDYMFANLTGQFIWTGI